MKAKNPNIKINKGGVAFPDPAKSGTSKRPPSLPSDYPSNGGPSTISPPAKVKTYNPNETYIFISCINFTILKKSENNFG